CVKLGTYFDYW
nr:immunoglobulin heavy chain junction region [Mus musculus]